MKQQDINWIKNLDPEGMNGTIQSVLLSNDLSTVGFESVLKFLLIRTLEEKHIDNYQTTVSVCTR